NRQPYRFPSAPGFLLARFHLSRTSFGAGEDCPSYRRNAPPVSRALWGTMVWIEKRTRAAGVTRRDVGHHWPRLEMAGAARHQAVPRPRSQWSHLLSARWTDY